MQTTEQPERRASRTPVDLAPRYRTPASFDYVEGRCIDLSEGGMFIAAKLPCENGTLLKFECAAFGDDSAVKGVARVVWRRTGEGDRPSGMGLKFVKLEPGTPEVITKLLAAAHEHGRTAPEAPLAAQVRVTESFVPDPQLPAHAQSVQPASAPAEQKPASVPPPSAAAAQPATAGSRASVRPQPAASETPVAAKAQATSTSNAGGGAAIWIALAVGAALLVLLLMR